MKDKEKTAEILKRIKLLSKHKNDIFFPELRCGTGYTGISERRIDAFTISSSAGNLTTAYEIKVSRGDFLKDLKDEIKQRGARIYADRFYYATPFGLLKIEEIPVWAGLIEFDLLKPTVERDLRYGRLITEIPHSRIVIDAPVLNKENPSWGLIAAMVRNINKRGYNNE